MNFFNEDLKTHVTEKEKETENILACVCLLDNSC